MIEKKDLNTEGKFAFPYECPICGAELSPEDNIDLENRNGKYVSILRCGNGDCRFSKILD